MKLYCYIFKNWIERLPSFSPLCYSRLLIQILNLFCEHILPKSDQHQQF